MVSDTVDIPMLPVRPRCGCLQLGSRLSSSKVSAVGPPPQTLLLLSWKFDGEELAQNSCCRLRSVLSNRSTTTASDVSMSLVFHAHHARAGVGDSAPHATSKLEMGRRAQIRSKRAAAFPILPSQSWRCLGILPPRA